tara:strand:- start:434 stop:703 length:270 start_codon:yes stop_codon:yes gene_type:complete
VAIEGQRFPTGACSPEHWDGNTLLVKRLVDLMFADEVEEPDMVEQARAICEPCPVRVECLSYGIDEQYGIYGGYTASERLHIRRERRNV